MRHGHPHERKHGMDFKGGKPGVRLFYEGSVGYAETCANRGN
jgi:hypothetical protein